MAETSPSRRRLALVLVFTALLSVASLAPVPSAQGIVIPRTVARTVPISLQTLAAGPGPSALRSTNDGLRALAPVRTRLDAACAPIWFTMVALSWHQQGAGEVGASIEHAAVIDDTDAQPDTHTPEYHPGLHTSDLYWLRDSRCVRFSLRMPGGVTLSDMHAQFINTSGTAAGPGTGPPQAPVAAALGYAGGAFGAAPADAVTTRPAMVTRAQWGAMKPRRNCLGFAPSIRMAYVHHTSGSNSYSPSQSDDIMRGIQYYHQITRGYCDIAYNFLVDKYGTIFVGRFKSTDTNVNVIPASQMGFNTFTFSVSAMGNYQAAQPSQAMVQSIEEVLAWRLDIAHLPPNGAAWMTSGGGPTDKYPDGQNVHLPLISGHRQTGVTDCPGNYLWAELPAIRQAVFDLGRPKFFRPKQSQGTITPVIEADQFTAQATDPLSWSVEITDGSGNAVRTLTADGQALSVTWDGTADNGLPVPPGLYTATIFGQAADGSSARPAVLRVSVSAIAPTPSPTPSPSPSPSPTSSAGASPGPSPTARAEIV